MPIHICRGFYSESVRTHVHIIFSLFGCLHTNLGLFSLTKFAILSVHPLSPTSLSCERTFSRRSRCSSNVEHDVTNKSLMYAQTNSKSEKSVNMHS